MSMFYELMMRKKEETLYPVIKGSLTDTDGIISGFVATGGNYLQVNNISSLASADSWEICLYLTNSEREYIIGTDKERIITVSRATGKIYLSSDGSNWDIASGVGSGYLPSTCYARIRFTGTKYIFDYSTDKVNWTVRAEVSSSTKIYAPSYLKIGAWLSSQTSNFTGSIDLPNSYIKLGSTKYNLQAVVGYTIVGSPTITDGVVSGFSASDYLKTNGSLTSLENVETVVKFKISSLTSSTRRPLGYASYDTASGVYISANGNLNLTAGRYTDNTVVSVPTNFVCSVNTWYWLKVQYKTNNIVVSISTDGVTYTQIGLGENINVSNIYLTLNRNFGIGTSLSQNGTYSEFVNGSIDLKETYIKKNNKLWFNGQEG